MQGILHIESQWKGDKSGGLLNTYVLPNKKSEIVFIRIVLFSYAGFRGKIYILSETRRNANKLADDIFLQYQQEAAKGDFLRRYALQTVSHHLLALPPSAILIIYSISVCIFTTQAQWLFIHTFQVVVRYWLITFPRTVSTSFTLELSSCNDNDNC